jgi:tyrosyl-tRNA synthetase
MHVIDQLRARGFLHQLTDEAAIRARMDAGPVTFYCGFDPTADSLHVGHLLPLMLMTHLARAGHDPIAVVGGGTAMVGDPSGRDESRDLLDTTRIDANKAAIREQIARFCDGRLVDNAEWLMGLGYIAFLRDIGRHFSVNRMLTAESVKLRLERNHGLSFLEFNYALLQSYDFVELFRRYGCTLQVGGQDQWFNIVSGIDLVRRLEGAETYGLTLPLLTTASGAKMGKTAAGAVWLSAARTAPFDYRQFWYNCDDRDVERFLKLFTFLPLDEIDALVAGDIREAKRVLAREATAVVHGREAAEAADAAARAAAQGSSTEDTPELAHALPAPLLDLLVAAGLTASRGEGRRLVAQGGVSLDGVRVSDPAVDVTVPGLVRVGKKKAVRLCLP